MSCLEFAKEEAYIAIERGDCMESDLWRREYSCVIADPPYGMSYESNWVKDKAKRLGGVIGDSQPFIWFLKKAYDNMDVDGSIVCFCHDRSFGDFKRACEIAGFTYRSQLVWDRMVHGMGNLKSSFGPRHDLAVFATKGKFEFPGKRPKSVLAHQRVSPSKMTHPTEKPVCLLEDLINHLTREGDIVLDPFMGSGSTGVAACNLRRGFIGIELDEGHYREASRRICEASGKESVGPISWSD